TSTPDCFSVASSSPSRPNTSRQPPCRRTTRWPCCASRTSNCEIADCAMLCWPLRLPTYRRFTCAGISVMTAALTSASYTTTSACCSRRHALRVSSSGSPGPAPTSATDPWRRNAEAGAETLRCCIRGGCCANHGRRHQLVRVSIVVLHKKRHLLPLQSNGCREQAPLPETRVAPLLTKTKQERCHGVLMEQNLLCHGGLGRATVGEWHGAYSDT